MRKGMNVLRKKDQNMCINPLVWQT